MLADTAWQWKVSRRGRVCELIAAPLPHLWIKPWAPPTVELALCQNWLSKEWSFLGRGRWAEEACYVLSPDALTASRPAKKPNLRLCLSRFHRRDRGWTGETTVLRASDLKLCWRRWNKGSWDYLHILLWYRTRGTYRSVGGNHGSATNESTVMMQHYWGYTLTWEGRKWFIDLFLLLSGSTHTYRRLRDVKHKLLK